MLNDYSLKQAVLDELTWEPSVNAAHIGVTSVDGIITLTGHVEKFQEKVCAENAARRVHDVKGVAEEIEVRLPDHIKHDDAQIAATVANRLEWDANLPKGAVQPRVEKGWVTLTGQVDWHYQSEAAMNDIRSLWGIIGVSNQITVKPKPNVESIRDCIMTALDRSYMDPANIDVSAVGGHVKLTGSVDSWYERDEAARTAWAAPGTTGVENDIMVT